MRLPKFADLTDDQRRLYLSVPFTGRTLVTGPPGTGKSVIAMLRALESSRTGRRTVVCMYNQMLRGYAATPAGGDPALMNTKWPDVQTVRQFFRRLWFDLSPAPHPAAERVLLDVPYEERDAAKPFGARWDRELWRGSRRGTWWIDPSRWRDNREALARWRPTSAPPSLDDREFEIDWKAFAGHLIKVTTGQIPAALNWGHLIVDEGQDFPPAFYEMLFMLSNFGFNHLPEADRPAVTVLADENQRLTAEANSRIEDIRRALCITPDHEFRLEDNFRNTAQVAAVSRHFFAGSSTGIPRAPLRRGPMPTLRRFENVAESCAFVANYARNNPRDQVGVLIADNNKARASYVDGLRQELPRRVVRTYAWDDAKADKVSEIEFDMPGTIVVLNRASCKGLEFDAVFVVDLQSARISEDALDFFRMGMYVMCSRARKALFLAWVGDNADRAPFLAHMPAPPVLSLS